MYHVSRDFVIPSLDGSREVDNKLDEGKVVTIDSYLDHYCARLATAEFQDLQFVERCRIPKRIGDNLVHRKKEVSGVARGGGGGGEGGGEGGSSTPFLNNNNKKATS